MSSRRNFFFRQRVTEAELDSAFDDLENADHNLAGDLGFVGVLANAVVSHHAPVADLTVDVSGPGIALDQLGRRLFFSALQNVNVASDDNGVSTDVSAAGKEKIVSVFVKFDRALSDPRIDGNSATVFFRADESFKFVVVQGGEAAAGGAAPPQLRADAILLADVTRRFGQGQILDEVISTARRQDAFVVAGAPRSLRRGRTTEAVADLLALYNVHVTGGADHHTAASIDYAGGGAWADGSPNPATSVEAQLDKLVAELAGAGGAAKIGAVATDGAPTALAAGSVKSQLDTLLGSVNALAATAVRTTAANVFSAMQTLNGADGDTNAVLKTTAAPTTRKLLWEIAGGGALNYRLYAASQAFELTLNARWDGAQWVKDAATPSSKLELSNAELRLRSDDAAASPFPDAWASTVSIGVTGHGQQSFDAGGNWTSSGPTETYVGYQGPSNTLGIISVGAGASFRKAFPATPSSVTFQLLSTGNITGGGLTPIVTTRSGTGVIATAVNLGDNTRFYAVVFAS